MLEVLPDLLADDLYREAIAEAAYIRERVEAVALLKEHDMADAEHYVLSWESLSDVARRPYRTSVAEALDNVLSVVTADV